MLLQLRPLSGIFKSDRLTINGNQKLHAKSLSQLLLEDVRIHHPSPNREPQGLAPYLFPLFSLILLILP